MDVSTIIKTFDAKEQAYFYILDEQLRLSKSNCKWSKIIEFKHYLIASMAIYNPSSLYPIIVHYEVRWGTHNKAVAKEEVVNDD